MLWIYSDGPNWVCPVCPVGGKPACPQCLQYQCQCPQFAHREAAVGGEATNPRLPTRPNLKCDKIDLTDHVAEMVVTNNGFFKENDPDWTFWPLCLQEILAPPHLSFSFLSDSNWAPREKGRTLKAVNVNPLFLLSIARLNLCWKLFIYPLFFPRKSESETWILFSLSFCSSKPAWVDDLTQSTATPRWQNQTHFHFILSQMMTIPGSWQGKCSLVHPEGLRGYKAAVLVWVGM